MANTWIISAAKLKTYRSLASAARMTAASAAAASMVIAHNLGQSPNFVRVCATRTENTLNASIPHYVHVNSFDASQIYLTVNPHSAAAAHDISLDIEAEVTHSISQ